MEAFSKLAELRSWAGPRETQGLADSVVRDFLDGDPHLAQAIAEAHAQVQLLRQEFSDVWGKPEGELAEALEAGFVNFYPEDQRNPYIPAGARGPWIVTCYGAVIHDSGGYGMLGFGHAPGSVLAVMNRPQVMANVMTPSFSQLRLQRRLMRELGHTRKDKPFAKIICINSGSEAMTVACRISDINARRMTDPGGRWAGRKIMYLSLQGGFHGRTDKPAQISNSSAKNYKQYLASFRGLENNRTVVPNDIAGLEEAFQWADANNVWFESMFMEPVMGEGDPGKAVTPEFFKRARELTRKYGTLLVVDSIQAGIRAHGCLSICDYPGFADLEGPDMESYSKAVNAGQYPLSILALTADTARIYVRGVYGNTMTTNPRALDVAVTVLDMLTPAVRANIQQRGREFLEKFARLAQEFPGTVRKVQGTGLLVSIDINPEHFAIVGHDGLEEYLRKDGLGVIHGGANSLRFTPHFEITSKEVDLVVDKVRNGLRNCPRKK